MTNKVKISTEMASKELIEFLDSMDIDTDVDSMLDDDRKDFEGLFQSILKPIVNGKAHIDGDSYVLTLKKPLGDEKTISIKEPTGVAWELIDRTKKGEEVKKIMRFAEGFTGVPYAQIRTMPNSDLKVLRVFATLFLV